MWETVRGGIRSKHIDMSNVKSMTAENLRFSV